MDYGIEGMSRWILAFRCDAAESNADVGLMESQSHEENKDSLESSTTTE